MSMVLQTLVKINHWLLSSCSLFCHVVLSPNTETRASPHRREVTALIVKFVLCLFYYSHFSCDYVLLLLWEAADQKMERGQDDSLLSFCGKRQNSCCGCMWSFYGNQKGTGTKVAAIGKTQLKLNLLSYM